jgi:hypothetical protein
MLGALPYQAKNAMGLVLRGLKRLRDALLVILAAAVIFVEEWLWVHLAAAMAAVGRLPVFRWIEARIAALPAWAAMVAFLLPTLILLPFKFAALWLIAHGKATLGVATIVLAKIAGTALVARVFVLTRPKLLTLAWFARLYGWYQGFRLRILARLHALPAWQLARRMAAQWKARLQAWRQARRGGRWMAARKLARRKG